MNRRSIMNEICRQYGFQDFDDAKNASLKELEVFNQPVDVKKVADIDWTKALRNSNYRHPQKSIDWANYVSNLLYRFVLQQGIDYRHFNTLLNFYGHSLDTRNIFIENKGYTTAILKSKYLYWELIMLNISQLAVSNPQFDKEKLCITVPFSELGDFDPVSTNISEIMHMFPNKLLGGKIEVNQHGQKATFYFSKKLLARIKYKKERKSLLEVLGIDGFNAGLQANAIL